MDQESRPRWVIAGYGYVGRRLAERLAKGCDVVALSRTASEPLLPGVRWIRADFDTAALPREALEAMESSALCYLAPPAEMGTVDARLERFLAALDGAKPSSLLYMSTTGVYGDAAGNWVHEESPLAPRSDGARRRVSAEAQVFAWCGEHKVRAVVLRVPGIYGPHRLPLDRLRRSEPVLRPDEAGPGNRIHVDDLVTVCIAAVQSGVQGVFNVGDGNHASTTEFLEAVARCAGLARPRRISREEARSQLSPGMLSFLEESRRIDNRRMLRLPGVQLRYADFEAGICASLEEMRES